MRALLVAHAENKQKKQDEFEALVHANRFQPTKAMDEDEVAFLNEKAAERRAAELARKEQDKMAETEYRLALAKQSEVKQEQVDLAKLMGQVTLLACAYACVSCCSLETVLASFMCKGACALCGYGLRCDVPAFAHTRIST